MRCRRSALNARRRAVCKRGPVPCYACAKQGGPRPEAKRPARIFHSHSSALSEKRTARIQK
eukprot:3468442-Alexandrium_andersonii.AAC.1